MNGSTHIYQPTAACRNEPQQLRRSLDRLAGKTIGFIDNAKPNFNHLADDLGELLVSKYGASAFIRHRKRGASVPATEQVLKDLQERADLIITGSGD